MSWTLEGGQPIWQQLCRQLERQILVGTYPPGGRLPPVRELAAQAGVNPNTMQRALAQLESEQSKELLSDFVSELFLSAADQRQKKERRQRLAQAEQRLRVQMEREVEAGVARVKKEMGQAVSQTMMEHKRELFAKRAQLVARISQELRQKLEQWVETPEYGQWTARQLQKALAALPEGQESVRLLCRPQDKTALEEALARCGRPGELESEPDIRLGGLRLECPSCHMAIDCTLDDAFEQTQGHIAEYLGLRLE